MDDGEWDEGFDAGLEAFLRAAAVDGDLRVDRVLKDSDWERTEVVYLRGAGGSEMGPYVRKVFAGATGERAMGRGYELLYRARCEGRRFSHLPDIYLCSDQVDRLVVLMEYVQGRTLGEWVDGAGEDRRVAIALAAIPQLCEALTELHTGMGEPVIHRDVKPANIICTGGGEVPASAVLVDLGISRAYRPGAGSDTRRFGTDGFAAPEQFGARQTDARTDVYAAGMTLAYCLLGRMPTAGDIERGFAGACRDQRLCSIARRATAFDPDDRYQTAEAMRWALMAVASDAEAQVTEHETQPTHPVPAHTHTPLLHRVISHLTGSTHPAMRMDDARTGDVMEFCPNCGAILGAQPGFEDNNGFWVCRACGQQLYGEGVYDGNRYPGVMWYCDQCGDLLNAQDGFDDIRDSWRCRRCGYVNRIASSEITG